MGKVKNYYWEEICQMSHHENEKYWELVQEGKAEQEYQDHLNAGEICQGGQCRYCDNDKTESKEATNETESSIYRF